MATTTFLSNATLTATYNSVTYDFSDQATNVTVTVGYDALETTAFTGTSSTGGRSYTKGLQSVDVSATLFLSYGGTGATGEVEQALAALVGQSATLVISPAGPTESDTNPEWTITGAYLESFTPINSSVGELSTVEVNWVGGTWARDVTAP